MVCGISSGTPAETAVPVRWVDEPLPPGMEEKLEQPTYAALHHGQQGPKESPSDEQVVIHGWAVISLKSLGSDPRLLCRVPSRHSLSGEPHSVFYSMAL